MGKKAKAPPAPDLVAANAAQVAANKDAAYDLRDQNRYSQVNPYGSNAWDTDPVTGKTTNTTSLSPEQQALYLGNNSLAQQMTGNAGGALGQFMNQYWGGSGAAPAAADASGGGSAGGGMLPSFGTSTGGSSSATGPVNADSRGNYLANYSSQTAGQGLPTGMYGADPATGVGGVGGGIQGDLDYSKLTAMPTTDPGVARQQAQDALYKMNTQYLDPQWQQAQTSLGTKLSNQGLVPGTEAFTRALRDLDDAQQKAYESARQSAIAGGGAEAERAQQMALALRNQGMTEAGNLGAFHNTAQAQRAGQLLTDTGQQRSLAGTLGAAQTTAGASMANAALANQLNTRNQSFNELLKMGEFGSGQQVKPTFTTSQGNLGSYSTGDLVGAENKDYANAVAAQQAKNSSGIGGMIPGALGLAGTYFGGPLMGAGANALLGAIKGVGGGAAAGGGAAGYQSAGGYGDAY